MADKEQLLASLIQEQKVLTEMAQAVANIAQCSDKSNNLHEIAHAVANIAQCSENSGPEGHEYVYWARRGSELDTAVEVEVCSSENGLSDGLDRDPCTGIEDALTVEQTTQTYTDISSSIVPNCSLQVPSSIDSYSPPEVRPNSFPTNNSLDSLDITNCYKKCTENESECDREKRMEEKRETARLQEQLMNQEYQKAIGYLLCSSKSKSGKQKKKQTMTAYLFFCRRYRAKIVARNPKMSFAQISKVLSHMWRNASEEEKNSYRIKLEQHRSKVNAIVEKNMIEKMKLFKQQKLADLESTMDNQLELLQADS